MNLFTFLGSEGFEPLKRALRLSFNFKHLINENERFLSFRVVLKALKKLSPYMTSTVTHLDFFRLFEAIVTTKAIINYTTLKGP